MHPYNAFDVKTMLLNNRITARDNYTDALMLLQAAYDGSELRLSEDAKMELAMRFRQELPLMYRYKMLNHPTRMTKFTQADIQRIWNAKI